MLIPWIYVFQLIISFPCQCVGEPFWSDGLPGPFWHLSDQGPNPMHLTHPLAKTLLFVKRSSISCLICGRCNWKPMICWCIP